MAKESLKEKLERRREELKRNSSGNILFQKADTTTRVRILNMGDEEEFIKEIQQFYLGGEIKGVISPQTIGEPCAITEGYNELKDSKDEDDNETAAKFPPKKKYVAWCAIAKDEKGKEWEDEEKFVLLSSGQYQDILDLYLDDEEWGDMTDPEDGYDLKLKREGSGKTDTTYSVSPCKPTAAPRKFRKKVYDMDELIRDIIPTYDETKDLLNKYLSLDPEDDGKDSKKSRRDRGERKSKRDRDGKRSKRKRDLDD